MNKEIKEKWVKALRSGEYKQGRGRLKLGDRYCCLGVLCDISGVGEWLLDDYFMTSTGGEYCNLPSEVAAAADLDSCRVIVDGYMESLIVLNDARGFSFEEIADLIEEQL